VPGDTIKASTVSPPRILHRLRRIRPDLAALEQIVPSGRRASSRSRLALRIDSGSLRQTVATFRENVERAKLDFVVMLAGMQRVEVG